MRRQTILPVGLILLSFGVISPAKAEITYRPEQGKLLQRCIAERTFLDDESDPIAASELADERLICLSRNKALDSLEARLSSLESDVSVMDAAITDKDWTHYKSAWAEALGIMKGLMLDAEKDKGSQDARNLLAMDGADLRYPLENAGLPIASNFDAASKTLLEKLNPDTAIAGRSIVQQVYDRAVEYSRDYSIFSTQKLEEKLKPAAADRSQVSENRALSDLQEMKDHYEKKNQKIQIAPEPSRSFFSDFISLIFACIFVEFLILAIGGFVKKRFPKLLNYPLFTASSFVTMLLVFLLNMVWPTAPMNLNLFILLIGTPGLYMAARELLAKNEAKKSTARTETIDPTGATKKRSNENTHGSAQWGTNSDMQRFHHFGGNAFALGRATGEPGQDMRFRYSGHVVTIAPTRSGKGVGAVIPNLLEYPGSCVVLDVKGENAAVTARARKAMGQAVYIVDPFKVLDGANQHRFNPMDILNVLSPDCIGDALLIADAMMAKEKHSEGNSVHFEETARTFLQGLILAVACHENREQRTLAEVRRILTMETDDFLEVIATMIDAPYLAHGIPARAANALMATPDKERGSILSTVRRFTAFLDDPRIAQCLSESDFRLADLKSQAMTVYLVIPANRIAPNVGFVRLFINATISGVTASAAPPKNKVLCILDEFGQLGYMKPVEDAVSLLSGYGLNFWIFLQDLSQIKGVYPRWQTFLANSAKTFFGTADLDTAKYISSSLGQFTIEYATSSESQNEGTSSATFSFKGNSSNEGSSMSHNQQLSGRALLTPDEIMKLGSLRPIVLINGEPPYLLTRLNYLTDPEYRGKFDQNPYHS